MNILVRLVSIHFVLSMTAAAVFAQTPPYNRTVTDRWLIKLEPGTYDVGTTPVGATRPC